MFDVKIHKRIDVTDEIYINIPKKAIFSIFNASPLLLLKLWEIVCNFFLLILTDFLTGLKF